MHDLVPAELRRQWAAEGFYSGQDSYTLFAAHARAHPDRVAVIDDAGSVTYAELLGKVHHVAARLLDAGIRPGDMVGIQVPNMHQAGAIDLAVAAVGAICMPYPVLFREREVTALLGRSKAKACVVVREFGGHDFPKMMEALRPDLPALETVLVLGDEAGDLGPDLGGTDDPGAPPAVTVDADSPARIFVTSGTEALPKMVVFSHNAICGGVGTVLADQQTGTDREMRVLCLAPLSSGFGSLGTFGTLARLGQTLVVTAAFEPGRVLGLVEQHRVTHLLAVPTMLIMLLAHPAVDEQDVSSLEVVATFGSAVARSTVEEARRRLGCVFVNGYGCSDGAMSQTGLADTAEQVSQTVGRPNPAITAIRIVDESGADVPAGEPGEVWGRGPLSPMCYLESPDLDARYRTPDGWTKTGDVGFLDADGYLHLVGRVKDIIIRGGYNISPGETEELLVAHPAILHAACVGMPDERLGERMCAYVVLRPDATPPSLDDLTAFLTEQGLARNKLPERLEIIPELPMNPVGKILKRVLRDTIIQTLAEENVCR